MKESSDQNHEAASRMHPLDGGFSRRSLLKSKVAAGAEVAALKFVGGQTGVPRSYTAPEQSALTASSMVFDRKHTAMVVSDPNRSKYEKKAAAQWI